MNTGTYYINQLSTRVKLEVMENILEQRPNEMEWIVSQNYRNLADFLSSIFVWNQSPQGRPYWVNVCRDGGNKDFIKKSIINHSL